MTDAPQPALAHLLDVLDLDEVGTAEVTITTARNAAAGRDAGASVPMSFGEDMTLFLGQSQKMPHGRVFGGQVLAQGVIACGRTVSTDTPRPLHSLHAYFMRPGDDTQPIHFAVEKMRDGRSFSTRRAHALQNGKPILSMSCSFQEPADGLDHQDPMPQVPLPDGLKSLSDVFGGIDHPGAKHLAEGRAIEQRHVEGNLFVAPGPEEVAHQSVWLRAIGELPDDPLLHSAVLAYASDYALLEPVLRRHGRQWTDGTLNVASLDHAMWFHRPARADEWVLYAQESPSAQGGRGLGIGRMFTADGTLVATVAQEGMLRLRPQTPT
ncbi:acyl-CoA thioesterase [Knoellia aerolata]|uniref:Acyl-CoA thioesterase 2 n=1 Tax=Knoellia aerolata DSM 18566 TaxID=1385519 RepID=A0A0A0JLJ0_9MICO|nr:acyl-CoA thioesterase II [Knoellia aerolata]KGN37619.1 acyl-CoA thioesterase [Knoellia aerolata DSM 18566]